MDGLRRAVDIAGGQTALARLIGKKQGHVWWWLNKKTLLPPEIALRIEAATGVPRHELRKDLWEPPSFKEAKLR